MDHDEVLNKTNTIACLIHSPACIAGCLVGLLLFVTASVAVEPGLPTQPPSAARADFAPLVAELFSALQYLSRYHPPKASPAIVQISRDEVSMLICDKPCGVLAAYLPEWGIIMADTLDPLNKPLDRSILLHELVHYLQDIDQRYVTETPCKRWFYRENEAYALQNSYLMSIHSLHHVGGMLEPSLCKDKPQDKKSNAFDVD